MDWNWFFSAVAQSCAAIVGIVGAFVFTKIIDNQSRFIQRVSRFREFENASLRLSDEAGIRSFQWVGKRRNKSKLGDLADDIKKDADVATAPEYYLAKNFSQYVPRDMVLDQISAVIAKELRRRESPPKRKDPLGIGAGYLHPNVMANLIPEPWTEINAEQELIDNYLVRLKDHVRRLTEFADKSALAPEQSKMITWVLVLGAVLFFGGVIYPLSFLPVDTGFELIISPRFFWGILFSLKGFILSLISTLYVSILAVLAWNNLRMRLSEEQLAKLRENTIIGNYSSDLRILYENQVQIAGESTT